MVGVQSRSNIRQVSIRIPLGERVMVSLGLHLQQCGSFNSHPARRAGDGIRSKENNMEKVSIRIPLGERVMVKLMEKENK